MLTPTGELPTAVRIPGAYDPVRDQFLVLVSAGSSDIVTHRLRFSGTPEWSVLPTLGSEPRPEFENLGAIYDPNGDRIVAMTRGNPWAVRFDLAQFVGAPIRDAGAGGTGPVVRGVWPNPARRALTVDFTLPAAGFAELAVFDVQGRRVWREGSHRAAGRHQMEVALAPSLAPGVYVVRLTQAGKAAAARAAVTR